MLLECTEPTPLTESADHRKVIPVSSDIMDLALGPYFPDCRYVKNAKVSYGTFPEKQLIPHDLKISATLSIPRSCYIESTGHFNAVEFNICFNQLGYVLFAHSIRTGLMRPFASWNDETFRRKQLPDVLIVGIENYFRKEIDATRFTAVSHLYYMKVARNQVFTKWAIQFSDEKGGSAGGEVFCAARLLTPASVKNEVP